ncbi:energy transducer TonB [Flavobacterium sp. SUN046]|uniref:energy transducer TonB n=1 Tax=Flavobacterium sp. SUN046 TaxID=3002440 RepID=UPI002DB6BEBD|nr:energy transducer TonB [Flavobacterium sp. SUN046]MEC4050437.1 energy transducer TonB [Flavobacterium sp. SUN046]
MKKLIVVGMFLLSLCQVQGQNQPTQIDNQLYKRTDVEVKPEYPGGMSAFYKYVAENFNAPKAKEFKGGKLFVAFTVEIDGSFTDIKVVKEIGFGTTEETIRLLKASKAWTPAEQNGKRVRCSFMLPVIIGSSN